MSPRDIQTQGLRDGQHVDIISEWDDGSTRRVERFRVVVLRHAQGCVAAYYPETNALVALDSKADGSNQPAYKSIVVRLEPSSVDAPVEGRPEGRATEGEPDPHTDRQRYVAPTHLS